MAGQERAMKGIVGPARAFWGARNPRERGMLAAAIAVVLLGLLYVALLNPALKGREELARQLPSLRQQAAELRAITREAGTKDARTATPVPAVTRASLERTLSRHGLAPQDLSVSGQTVRLRLDNTSFANLVDWLSEMQRSARLAVFEAKIEAGAESDNVNAALTLRQERAESQ